MNLDYGVKKKLEICVRYKKKSRAAGVRATANL